MMCCVFRFRNVDVALCVSPARMRCVQVLPVCGLELNFFQQYRRMKESPIALHCNAFTVVLG